MFYSTFLLGYSRLRTVGYPEKEQKSVLFYFFSRLPWVTQTESVTEHKRLFLFFFVFFLSIFSHIFSLIGKVSAFEAASYWFKSIKVSKFLILFLFYYYFCIVFILTFASLASCATLASCARLPTLAGS